MKWLLRQAGAVFLACLALRVAVELVSPVLPFLLLGAMVLVSVYWFVRTH